MNAILYGNIVWYTRYFAQVGTEYSVVVQFSNCSITICWRRKLGPKKMHSLALSVTRCALLKSCHALIETTSLSVILCSIHRQFRKILHLALCNTLHHVAVVFNITESGLLASFSTTSYPVVIVELPQSAYLTGAGTIVFSPRQCHRERRSF